MYLLGFVCCLLGFEECGHELLVYPIMSLSAWWIWLIFSLVLALRYRADAVWWWSDLCRCWKSLTVSFHFCSFRLTVYRNVGLARLAMWRNNCGCWVLFWGGERTWIHILWHNTGRPPLYFRCMSRTKHRYMPNSGFRRCKLVRDIGMCVSTCGDVHIENRALHVAACCYWWSEYGIEFIGRVVLSSGSSCCVVIDSAFKVQLGSGFFRILGCRWTVGNDAWSKAGKVYATIDEEWRRESHLRGVGASRWECDRLPICFCSLRFGGRRRGKRSHCSGFWFRYWNTFGHRKDFFLIFYFLILVLCSCMYSSLGCVCGDATTGSTSVSSWLRYISGHSLGFYQSVLIKGWYDISYLVSQSNLDTKL